MIILGIETSCDETAAAVVRNGEEILSNITATSSGLHARTGGIIPEQAARKQIEVMIPVINLALENANITEDQIDAIAVTYGPGLIGSLLVGVETAKTLSYIWNKPIIPVNHLIAHIYAVFASDKSNLIQKLPKFPALALVVSGGHTDLVMVSDHGKLKWIGGTRDDAAGEAFDKTARLLGLPYPGGPEISKLADEYISKNPNTPLNLFPRPMIDSDNFDWSFSGLKTAVLNYVNEMGTTNNNLKLSEYKKLSEDKNIKRLSPKIAAEIQEAIVDSLVLKSIKAIKQYQPKSFILGGGVSANKRLVDKFNLGFERQKLKTDFFAPQSKLSTDNATAIATCAYFNSKSIDWRKITANPQLEIVTNDT